MRDYLIDTNIWGYWFDPNKKEHNNILEHISKLKTGDDHLWISVVTWGEIEYGYNSMSRDQRSFEEEFRLFVNNQSPMIFNIDRHVTKAYGEIRAALFEKYAPGEKKKKIKRPEQLFDPITAKELGIQENDLWIVAQALTREMVLVTNDKKLIRPIVEILGNKLIIENWSEQQIKD